VAWLATAVVLSFALRLPFLRVPLITDEGGYAYVARRWLDGRGDLYHDLWFDRPQGIFLVYGLILHTLGPDVVAIRLGAWLASVLTLFVVWGFVRDIRDARAAWLAAILFAIISSSPAIEGFTANAEVFMALPAAGSAWLLLRASQNAWRTWTIVATGLLIGVATLLKPPGIVMLPLAIAFIWLVGPARINTIVRRWAWLIAGFAFAIIPSLVHGWLIGWEDFISAVTYRLRHRSATTIPPEEHLDALFELITQVWPMLAAVALPFAAWWSWRGTVHNAERRPREPQPEISILRRFAGRPLVKPGTEASMLLRLWLLAALAGIAMGGNWFPHYLIQIAAPLAIWLAMLLRDLASRFHRWLWWLLVTATASLLLWPHSVVITTGNDADALSRRLFDRETYPEQAVIASYLRACTAPESPVTSPSTRHPSITLPTGRLPIAIFIAGSLKRPQAPKKRSSPCSRLRNVRLLSWTCISKHRFRTAALPFGEWSRGSTIWKPRSTATRSTGSTRKTHERRRRPQPVLMRRTGTPSQALCDRQRRHSSSRCQKHSPSGTLR
jgi:4-amino-4-deoxy-L-arabinose transferase-like glycosyltransferase